MKCGLEHSPPVERCPALAPTLIYVVFMKQFSLLSSTFYLDPSYEIRREEAYSLKCLGTIIIHFQNNLSLTTIIVL